MSRPNSKSLYDILQVSPSANRQEITRKFSYLAKLVQPNETGNEEFISAAYKDVSCLHW